MEPAALAVGRGMKGQAPWPRPRPRGRRIAPWQHAGMPSDRDVRRFDRRASAYDEGGLGEWHRRITRRAADVVLSAAPGATRILDVGCGTGMLLALLAEEAPHALELAGVDP